MAEAALGQEFTVKPTQDRSGARGNYIVQLAPLALVQMRLREKRYVAVERGERAVIAYLLSSADIEDPTACRIDQSLRERLGLPARPSGETVRLYRLEGALRGVPFLYPRRLVLSLRPSSRHDAEKNIAIVHPDDAYLLGLAERGHIRALVALPDDSGPERVYRLSQVTRRAFVRNTYEESGNPFEQADEAARSDVRMRDVVRLDLEARDNLERRADLRFGPRSDSFLDYPVLVQANLWRLLLNRMYTYLLTVGLTWVVGMIGLAQFGLSWLFSVALAVPTALAISILVGFLDFRGRVSY